MKTAYRRRIANIQRKGIYVYSKHHITVPTSHYREWQIKDRQIKFSFFQVLTQT